MTKNKEQEVGTWTLTSPSGVEFKAESPLKCCGKERKVRISDDVAVARVASFFNNCDLCEESVATHILWKGTTIELRLCETCKNKHELHLRKTL